MRRGAVGQSLLRDALDGPQAPLRSSVRLLAGLWLSALGTVMTLRAHLGMAPWDVLHDGLHRTTSLSFGQAVFVVGAVLLGVSAAGGIRPGLGTVLNVAVIGLFDDLLLRTGLGADLSHDTPLARGAILVGGLVAVAFGTAVYVSAAQGAGPRDSLQLAVSARLRLPPGLARWLIEGSALAIGVLLGGRIGPGTVVSVVAIGPAMQLVFRSLHLT